MLTIVSNENTRSRATKMELWVEEEEQQLIRMSNQLTLAAHPRGGSAGWMYAGSPSVAGEASARPLVGHRTSAIQAQQVCGRAWGGECRWVGGGVKCERKREKERSWRATEALPSKHSRYVCV
jgi:hypothetical protein